MEDTLRLLLRLLDERQARLLKNRKYSEGQAPLPEMGKNTRASWEKFQKKARTNYGGLAVSAISDRIVPNGVVVGSDDSPASVFLREVWRNNRLDQVFLDAIWNMLATGHGYVMASQRDEKIVVTSEKPEDFITLPDPVQPWRAQAALKVWRDPIAALDNARLFTPYGTGSQITLFQRPAKTSAGSWLKKNSETIEQGGRWLPVGVKVTQETGVPVHVLDNVQGKSEFEDHVDVIDRINLGKLNRLVITAMQAFKQRAIKGATDAVDDEGNAIDYAKVLEPAPGAMWDLPEGIDIWEAQNTDITPLLSAERRDAEDFAAVTRLSVSTFLPAGANQSAAGADASQKGEISIAKKRIKRIRPALEGVMLEALRTQGLDDGSTVQVLFEPPEYVSYSEKADAASKGKSGGLADRTILRDIWGMTPEQINENEQNRAQEQLAQNILAARALSNESI